LRARGRTLARIAPTGDQRGASPSVFKAARHCGVGARAPGREQRRTNTPIREAAEGTPGSLVHVPRKSHVIRKRLIAVATRENFSLRFDPNPRAGWQAPLGSAASWTGRTITKFRTIPLLKPPSPRASPVVLIARPGLRSHPRPRMRRAPQFWRRPLF